MVLYVDKISAFSWVFQHNPNSKLIAKVVRDWLQTSNVNLLKWPVVWNIVHCTYTKAKGVMAIKDYNICICMYKEFQSQICCSNKNKGVFYRLLDTKNIYFLALIISFRMFNHYLWLKFKKIIFYLNLFN